MLNSSILDYIKKNKRIIEKNRKELAKLAILVGSALTLHHRETSGGKWYDEDENLCHGKAGIMLVLLGLAALN